MLRWAKKKNPYSHSKLLIFTVHQPVPAAERWQGYVLPGTYTIITGCLQSGPLKQEKQFGAAGCKSLSWTLTFQPGGKLVRPQTAFLLGKQLQSSKSSTQNSFKHLRGHCANVARDRTSKDSGFHWSDGNRKRSCGDQRPPPGQPCSCCSSGLASSGTSLSSCTHPGTAPHPLLHGWEEKLAPVCIQFPLPLPASSSFKWQKNESEISFLRGLNGRTSFYMQWYGWETATWKHVANVLHEHRKQLVPNQNLNQKWDRC